MLSIVSRTARPSYICTRCRTRLLSRSPITATARHRQTFPALRRSHVTATAYAYPDPRTDNQTLDTVPRYEEELDLRRTTFGPKTRPWESIGLRPVVADTLLRAFPNAQRPTPVQKKILTALTYGYSLSVRGLPGTGKSFAIAAWLLGLERSLKTGTRTPTTSALVLVPNVDLGVQYHSMILTMLQNSDSKKVRENPDAFVQLLFRRGVDSELEQLKRLKAFPHPHIILAPPTIILDLLADGQESVRSMIDLNHLKVIVLEEVDAAITLIAYFSRLKKGRGIEAEAERANPRQVPMQILLDYVIKCRLADAHKRGVAPQQPQLVFPSSTLSPTQVKRFLVWHHRDWLHASELNMDMSPNTFRTGEEWRRRARSNSLISVEDPPLVRDKITPYIPDHLHHHVIAYDIRTGTLRDAPLPPMRHLSKDDIVAQQAMNGQLKEQIQDEIQDEDAVPNKLHVPGYPPDIVVSIVMQLLEHDKYPSNVVVGLSPESDLESFKLAFRAQGIKCRYLTAVKWQSGSEPGKLPLGRTDMLLTPSVRTRLEREAAGGDKRVTTVWLTSSFYSRGIQTPGINHLYILHRILRPREYISYSGRVASWPHGQLAVELADPRAAGRDRRPVGRMVSVVLEDNEIEHADKEKKPIMFQRNGKDVKSMVVARDGSETERLTWSTEAIRLAKLGCLVEPYFVDRSGSGGESESEKGEGASPPPPPVEEGKGPVEEGNTPVVAAEEVGNVPPPAEEEGGKKDFLMAMKLLDEFEAEKKK